MVRITRPKELDGPLTLLKRSFLLYRSRFQTFVSLGAIAFGVGVIQLFAIHMNSMVLFLLSVIAAILVSYIIYVAMVRVASAPGKMTVSEVLTRVEHFIVPAIWVSLLMILLALGGTLLLIIPGIIVSVFIMFGLFGVVVEHCQQTEAIVHSWHLVKGRWFPVFGRLLVASIVFGLISWIGIMICWILGLGETPFETIERATAGDFQISLSQAVIEQCIANIFSLPLAISFLATLYDELKRTSPRALTSAENTQIRKYIKVLTMLGIACLIFGLFFSSLRLMQLIPELIVATHAPAAVFSAF